MAWSPNATELGPHTELETFSHTITYEETDPILLTTVSYSVRIIPVESLPSTVTISGATIAGYFKRVFNDTIKYKTFNKEIKTAVTDPDNGAWDKVNNAEVYETLSFKADTSRSIIKHYNAEAYDPLFPNTVIASKSYTINIRDLNWTTGQNLLKDLVNLTKSR
jgi:hypothetical protein